jgi:DNA-directed RNA polymerase subunit beta'
MIERQTKEVWDILEEVTKGHPVLLNRAPTLHRLSIQAFEPQLIEGEAIRIHPLVCTAYNADFDGDQMAVHVPLSVEAQMEARLLMMAPNNIFSPSSGKPIITPTQDITLGCYYSPPSRARKPRAGTKRSKLPLFGSKEVIFAYSDGAVEDARPHPPGQSRPGQAKPSTATRQEAHRDDRRPRDLSAKSGRRTRLPNKPVKKSELGDLIWKCYKFAGHEKTVIMLDKLKELGFREATKSGVSIGIDDMIMPKEATRRSTRPEADQGSREAISQGRHHPGERYNKIVDIWTHCTDQISNVMFRTLEQNQGKKEYNPVYLMVDSGARGNKQQVRQLAGCAASWPSPAATSSRSRFSQLPRRPDGAGILHLHARRPQGSGRHRAQDRRLRLHDPQAGGRGAGRHHPQEQDCGTTNGIWVQAIYEGEDEVVKLGDRIIGRFPATTSSNPTNPKEFLIKANEEIDEVKAKRIEAAALNACASARCSPAKASTAFAPLLRPQPATGGLVKLGEAVGIIAAQSIGEPGTQLTMRTFHIGGTPAAGLQAAADQGQVRRHGPYNELRVVELEDGNNIVLNKNGSIHLAEDGRELENHNIVIGSVISVKDGGKVKKGDTFVQWDPVQRPDSFREGRQGEVPRHHRRRHHEAGNGRNHRPGSHGRHRAQGGFAPANHHQRRQGRSGGQLSDSLRRAHRRERRRQNRRRHADGQDAAQDVQDQGHHRRSAARGRIVRGAPSQGRAGNFQDRRHRGFWPSVRGKRTILIKDPQTKAEEEHLIPIGKHVIVFKGDMVKKGQQLTEGPMDPHEILDICGPQELQEHLVNEVQEVYRLQGVTINDKHIEIIVRQMLRKVRITEPGDTQFLWGEQIDKLEFEEENERASRRWAASRPKPRPCCWASPRRRWKPTASSAPRPSRTRPACSPRPPRGQGDSLRGFKENVIMGHIIPAGTGRPKRGFREREYFSPKSSCRRFGAGSFNLFSQIFTLNRLACRPSASSSAKAAARFASSPSPRL